MVDYPEPEAAAGTQLYDLHSMAHLARERQAWEDAVATSGREAPRPFITSSGRPIERLHSPYPAARAPTTRPNLKLTKFEFLTACTA